MLQLSAASLAPSAGSSRTMDGTRIVLHAKMFPSRVAVASAAGVMLAPTIELIGVTGCAHW